MKNSAPQPSARQVRCRRTINESAMHPVPAGTGQQPRIVAGYNLFVVGLGFIQSCHNRTSTRLQVEVLPLPELQTIHSRREKSTSAESRDEGSDAPAVRMMWKSYPNGECPKKRTSC